MSVYNKFVYNGYALLQETVKRNVIVDINNLLKICIHHVIVARQKY